MKETTNKILNEIAERFNIKEISMDTSLNDLGLDSLDVAEFLLDLEDKYNISFESDEMQKVTTLQSLTDLIDSKVK